MLERRLNSVSVGALGILFIAYLLGQSAFATLFQFDDPCVRLVVIFGSTIALLALFTVLLVRLSALSLEAIGFRAVHRKWIALGFAAGLLALLAVQLLGLLISMEGQKALNNYTHGQVIYSTGRQFALSLLTLAVFAPFLEEFLFRGVLFSALKERLGFMIAVLGSSLLFAVLHASTLAVLENGVDQALVIASLSVVGLVAVWLRYQSGSLYAAIVMHGSYNMFVFILQILSS